MKHDAKSRGCRVDLSVVELEVLLHLAKRGRDEMAADGVGLPLHQHLIGPCIDGLAAALSGQRGLVDRQRSARASKRAAAAGPDKRWKRSLIVDGHNVTAERDDYVDNGSLDFAHWQSLAFLEAMNKVPEQAEIRRDVWLVRVCTTAEQRAENDRMFVGTDLTATNNPADIEPLARRILEENHLA